MTLEKNLGQGKQGKRRKISFEPQNWGKYGKNQENFSKSAWT